MLEFGHFAVMTALVLAMVGIATPWIGLSTRNGVWVSVGRQAVLLNFCLISIGMAGMIYSFVTQDYSVKYVFATSNSKLSLFYKVAGLWGGHEGSLLLWAWVLSLFCALAVMIHWKTQPAVMPYLISIESTLLTGFLLLILFLSNPFERTPFTPPDGKDLNPLLQDPAMVIHPPMLYLGYVGLSIPYCFAMAALFSGRLSEEWIKTTQRWTLFAWLALTTGILMGGYWAYYELGWGGYWGWDPVENASFMPWLIATAFLHSVMVQETRKMFLVWNLFLIILAFSLSLIGTFLVRSGVLSSVHSFATDPGRGLFILGFLTFMLCLSFGMLILRSSKLKSKVVMESLLSREAIFLYNNLFFVTAFVIVFIGTLYPLFIEVMKFQKVSVGAPYYNAVFMPVAWGLILLMGIGPYIPWRKCSIAAIKDILTVPFAIGFCALPLLYVMGMRDMYALAALSVTFFTGTAIVRDYLQLTKMWADRYQLKKSSAFLKVLRQNPRKTAGILTHVGVLVMTIGVVCSTLFQAEKIQAMKPSESVMLNDYRFKLIQIYPVTGSNWSGHEGFFEVYDKNNKLVASLRPQKRLYEVSQTPTTEAAIHQIYTGHLFVTIPDVSPDASWVRVRALHNPLVLWVWYGGAIMGLGVLMNIFRGVIFSLGKKKVVVSPPVAPSVEGAPPLGAVG
ncbi:MAG: heme lyase CcmF/NrfE family subunit [Nitrospirota bacterium]